MTPLTTETKTRPTVFVVDDEEDMRFLARAVLARAGLEVIEDAVDGPQALERFYTLDPPPVPSVVVLDNRMPGLTGLQVAELMLAHSPGQVIILFSAYLDREVEEAARDIGVAACVSKSELRRLPEIIRGLLASGDVRD